MRSALLVIEVVCFFVAIVSHAIAIGIQTFSVGFGFQLFVNWGLGALVFASPLFFTIFNDKHFRVTYIVSIFLSLVALTYYVTEILAFVALLLVRGAGLAVLIFLGLAGATHAVNIVVNFALMSHTPHTVETPSRQLGYSWLFTIVSTVLMLGAGALQVVYVFSGDSTSPGNPTTGLIASAAFALMFCFSPVVLMLFQRMVLGGFCAATSDAMLRVTIVVFVHSLVVGIYVTIDVANVTFLPTSLLLVCLSFWAMVVATGTMVGALLTTITVPPTAPKIKHRHHAHGTEGKPLISSTAL